ncbi:MAG: hypothetical protein K5777_05975 [Nitrosopumilus sp.]|nr:hypothetical protein [Nitrosopumilus sp.]
MNNFTVKELYSEKHVQLPSVSSLLKISLGLILFTMISTVLVYAEIMTVDVDGTSYDIEYDATGMTVSGFEVDTEAGSLILFVDVTGSPGILNIQLERSFFDSQFEDIDEDFFVLADLDDAKFEETETTTTSRTLRIELPSGTEDVEIIGYSFNNAVSEVETPVEETPVDETPVEETPVDETPVEETPVDKTPVEKTPTDTTPKTQCGPGTILKDGACVLDKRCGPGTILKDGTCVLDSTPQPSSSSVKGMGKDLLMGFVIAFVGAGIVGIVFGIIAKASKSN